MPEHCEGTLDLFAPRQSSADSRAVEAYLLRWLRARYLGGVRQVSSIEVMVQCREEHAGIRGGSPATWERAWRWIRNHGWVRVSELPERITRGGETFSVWTLLEPPPAHAPEAITHRGRPSRLLASPPAEAQ